MGMRRRVCKKKEAELWGDAREATVLFPIPIRD